MVGGMINLSMWIEGRAAKVSSSRGAGGPVWLRRHEAPLGFDGQAWHYGVRREEGSFGPARHAVCYRLWYRRGRSLVREGGPYGVRGAG